MRIRKSIALVGLATFIGMLSIPPHNNIGKEPIYPEIEKRRITLQEAKKGDHAKRQEYLQELFEESAPEYIESIRYDPKGLESTRRLETILQDKGLDEETRNKWITQHRIKQRFKRKDHLASVLALTPLVGDERKRFVFVKEGFFDSENVTNRHDALSVIDHEVYHAKQGFEGRIGIKKIPTKRTVKYEGKRIELQSAAEVMSYDMMTGNLRGEIINLTDEMAAYGTQIQEMKRNEREVSPELKGLVESKFKRSYNILLRELTGNRLTEYEKYYVEPTIEYFTKLTEKNR